MKIDKPIFILAPARSGTTIFYNLFTRHKDTAFPEHFADKYWKSSWKFKLIPLMVKQQIWRYKKRPLPHEGGFWRKYHPYSTYLDETDVTLQEKNYIYSAITAQLRAFNAKRFVGRVHDFMLQIRFLNELFPDAFYIILKRDPKAVVNSQYKMMLGVWKKNGVGSGNNYGRVIEKFAKENSVLESCINYYNHYVNTMEKDLSLIKEKTKFVQYESFVKNPRYELKRLYEYTDLPWYDELKNDIPEVLELTSLDKWHSLPDHEKEILENAFK